MLRVKIILAVVCSVLLGGNTVIATMAPNANHQGTSPVVMHSQTGLQMSISSFQAMSVNQGGMSQLAASTVTSALPVSAKLTGDPTGQTITAQQFGDTITSFAPNLEGQQDMGLFANTDTRNGQYMASGDGNTSSTYNFGDGQDQHCAHIDQGTQIV